MNNYLTNLYVDNDYSHNKSLVADVVLQYKRINMKKLFFIPLMSMLFACQPSKITQSWSAKNMVPKKYKKILVLGVLTDKDYELQVKMENHLADDLRGMGYPAIAANKVFPTGTFVKGDTAKAVRALDGKGFDAILTIVMLDKKKERYYVPGIKTDYSEYNKYSRFDLYYNVISDRIYTPGYYGEETKYIWENNFYDLNNRQMIYTARTRSFDISSKTTLAHTFGFLLVDNLVKKKILIKPAEAEVE